MAESRVRKVKKKYGKVWEHTVIERVAVMDKDKAKEIEKYIDSNDVFTPQELSKKHEVRVSLARRILEKYAEDGALQLKYKNGSNEIYSK